jgi:hypothetical protein
MNQNDILQKGDNRPLKKNSQPVALGDELQMTDDRWRIQVEERNFERWLEWNNDDPDDYEGACRRLVTIIYKEDGNHDPETIKDVQDKSDLIASTGYGLLGVVNEGLEQNTTAQEKAKEPGRPTYITVPGIDEVHVLPDQWKAPSAATTQTERKNPGVSWKMRKWRTSLLRKKVDGWQKSKQDFWKKRPKGLQLSKSVKKGKKRLGLNHSKVELRLLDWRPKLKSGIRIYSCLPNCRHSYSSRRR